MEHPANAFVKPPASVTLDSIFGERESREEREGQQRGNVSFLKPGHCFPAFLIRKSQFVNRNS
jgi:hypothetical protein